MTNKILLITNNTKTDGEDFFLKLNLESKGWNITLSTSQDAIPIIHKFDICFFRNAWPSYLNRSAIMKLINKCERLNIPYYSPTQSKRRIIEDKHYLLELYQKEYPAIPTWNKYDSIPNKIPIVLKSIHGCCNNSIIFFDNKKQIKQLPTGYIAQKKINIKYETAHYIIDNKLIYSTRSNKPKIAPNFETTEYSPTKKELKIIEQFQTWANQPYGIFRIDLALTRNNQWFLMEVENQLCKLALNQLKPQTLNKCIASINNALRNYLKNHKAIAFQAHYPLQVLNAFLHNLELPSDNH